MRLTIEDKHLIKWLWVSKNYVAKNEDEVLMGERVRAYSNERFSAAH